MGPIKLLATLELNPLRQKYKKLMRLLRGAPLMRIEAAPEKCLSIFIVPLDLGPQQNTYIFIQTSCLIIGQPLLR